MPTKVTATDVQKFTVYHSPQTPGYTCWVGAWVMPDETLMISFHQATGPFSGRPSAPKDVLEKLTWPPGDGTNFGYDMTGLIQQVIILASTDGGQTWEQVGTYPYHSPMNGMGGKGTVGLPDGTIIREVIGHYLPFWNVPQTGCVQRSTDGGQTWGSLEPIMDPDEFRTYPGRIRLLRDGRAVLLGAYAASINAQTRAQSQRYRKPSMWISSDGGHSWSEPLAVTLPQEGVHFTEESDLAELPDGRLLVVDRANPAAPRWQSVFEPEGDTFRLVSFELAPLPYSGYPDLLATTEGLVLHLASTGIHWTADAGENWHDLGIGGTGYYPCSVQLPDGRIFCVYHRGSDNPYDGSVDQEIQAMTFRLEVEE